MLINTQRRNLLRQSRQIVKLIDHHSSFPFCDRAAPLSHQPIHLRRETVTVVPPPKASAPTSHHPPRYSHSDRRSLHRRYIFERFGQLLLEVQEFCSSSTLKPGCHFFLWNLGKKIRRRIFCPNIVIPLGRKGLPGASEKTKDFTGKKVILWYWYYLGGLGTK